MGAVDPAGAAHGLIAVGEVVLAIDGQSTFGWTGAEAEAVV